MQSAPRNSTQPDVTPLPSAQTGTVKTDGTSTTPGNDTRFPVTFTGRGGEYFRIWIVNVLLSILTLYIYSAWAKVRTQRYFAGNTLLDGSAFEYHATGKQILLGRIVAVVLLILTVVAGVIHPAAQAVTTVLLLLALPWAIWRSLKFNMRMTSYRNVRFGFAGSLGAMYINMLVLPFLPLVIGGIAAAAAAYFLQDPTVAVGIGALAILSIYLIAPWVHKKLAQYTLNGYRFGQAAFSATLSTTRFYAIYIKALLVAIMTGVAIVSVLAIVAGLTDVFSADTLAALGESDDAESNPAILIIFALSYPVFFLAGFLVKAYHTVRIRQHLLAQSALDGRVRFKSTMRLMPFWWLAVSNILLLLVTLGLAYPWTKIRTARYIANNTVLHSASGLHAIVDDEHTYQSSLGEEIGDAFDMDMDVGF